MVLGLATAAAVSIGCGGISAESRRGLRRCRTRLKLKIEVKFGPIHHTTWAKASSPSLILGPKTLMDSKWATNPIPSATNGNKASDEDLTSDDKLPSYNPYPEISPQGSDETKPKRSLLTARERLRAARVLSRYTESKPSKPEFGSKVLDALRESERGKRKRSGLPEAPTNLLDDSKRGMPKEGLTFSFPVGGDLFFIAFSFVFISTVMFATTYVVWRAGAIHFNEY